jgi:hypothetical protein
MSKSSDQLADDLRRALRLFDDDRCNVHSKRNGEIVLSGGLARRVLRYVKFAEHTYTGAGNCVTVMPGEN